MKWLKQPEEYLAVSEKGQSVIEYVLLVVVILLATVTLVPQVGTAIKSKIQEILTLLGNIPDEV